MIFLPLKALCWVTLLLFGVAIISRRRQALEFVTRIRGLRGRQIRLNTSFAEDVEAGLTSENFDILRHNEGDERRGLDDKSKREIEDIMRLRSISFDEARLQYMKQMFGKNEIALDGTPLDPKAVTFGRS